MKLKNFSGLTDILHSITIFNPISGNQKIKTSIMPLFDYNALVQSLPDVWRTTKGKGVKIAVLDTGCDLTHPALQHLDIDGRKFNVTKDGFDPDDLTGADDVTDDYKAHNPHGTKMLSLIAGKVDETQTTQIQGLAPEAEVFIIKVGGLGKSITLNRLLNGLELAIKLKVDIISTSFLPNRQSQFDQARVDAIFSTIQNENIVVCASLENTGFIDKFNNPDRLPTMRDEVFKVGVCFKKTMNKVGSGITYNENISLLLPQIDLTYCIRQNGGDGFETNKNKCSTATALAAGVIALILSFKRQEDPEFERLTKDELMIELDNFRHNFEYDKVTASTTLQFFSPKKPNLP